MTTEPVAPGEHRLLVIPVVREMEGLRLADGQMIIVKINEPESVFAVVHHDGAEVKNVVSIHATQREAIEAADALQQRLTGAVIVPGGGLPQ